MAGITSVHSDSESSTKVTSKAKDKPAALASAAASGDESQEEDGSEYEIEEVLDAKRGFFPDVCPFSVVLICALMLMTRFDAPRDVWATSLNGRAMTIRRTVGWMS
jgi:hypothetical protein